MAIYINLDKASVSQVMVNGNVQKVEYENLPMVCFSCGHYGHIKEICPKIVHEQNQAGAVNNYNEGSRNSSLLLQTKEIPKNPSSYGHWMIFEKKGRRGTRVPQKVAEIKDHNLEGTRF